MLLLDKCTGTKLNPNSYLVVSISSSIILIVSCKLQSSFSIFLLEEKQTVSVIRKNNSNKKLKKTYLTSVHNDSHLDWTFL